MGTWRGLRVAFILGSLFMILLIITYWDDVGGFNLYPLRDRKHERCPQSTTGHPLPAHTLPASSARISSTTWPPAGLNKSAEGRERPQLEREDEEGDESPDSVGSREQMARKQRIMDVCSGNDFPGRTRAFEQIPNRELDHLIVDDTHQIIYCYVPKVACTNWKRVMVVLSQSLVSPVSGKPYTDPESVPPDLVHNSTLHLTFAKPNEDFYRQFGSVILRRYGNLSGSLPETAAEAFAAGIKPTFQQFVSYLLDAETEKESIFNEHWRQVYRLCHPCQVKYDFIGRLETLETDAEHLLKLLQVDHLLRFPSGARNRTAASWERDWFAQIPVSMRTELYKLYQPDFELFGYPKPDGVLHHR
ncbi:carbohydrate sulfotransferase 12-like isoform X2 [Hippocampus zosterae]|uniref:carbohydrate sulfotransferase 12-like isoform X2 n=1 Tax=Hippocampus zosterae TaxID=109293 RepID=UPI00223D6B53|nr:carbohydrate sulfotransferase 12-like isoform X2 [Hippocampus zosterae]